MAYIPNLKWTVGDMDRLQYAKSWRHRSAEEICAKLAGTQLACTPERIREICRHFHVKLYGEAKSA